MADDDTTTDTNSGSYSPALALAPFVASLHQLLRSQGALKLLQEEQTTADVVDTLCCLTATESAEGDTILSKALGGSC